MRSFILRDWVKLPGSLSEEEARSLCTVHWLGFEDDVPWGDARGVEHGPRARTHRRKSRGGDAT